MRDLIEYTAFLDDSSEGLTNYEYRIEAQSEEEALAKTLEQYPCAHVTAIVQSSELDEADIWRKRARIVRESEKAVLGKLWPKDLAKEIFRFPGAEKL